MASSPPIIEIVSKHSIKPWPESSHERRCDLTSWDVIHLGCHYMQYGLLFTNIPSTFPTPRILTLLKTSLSAALRHFYPLAGRLLTETQHNEDGNATGLQVFVDCNDKGADFIHAIAGNMDSSDVLAHGKDDPSFIDSLFPLTGAVNHDGHSAPLLSVQATELAGGALFLACSFNHAVGDGVSYWNLLNGWAEIARTDTLSQPPVHKKRFFEEQHSSPVTVTLPFSDLSQFLMPFALPEDVRQRLFHFSSQSVGMLKERANKEVGTTPISSFQALCAMLWRAITRTRSFEAKQLTTRRLAIDNRTRLRPQQSPAYFGNCASAVAATVPAGELLAHGLGWAARELNMAIAGYTSATIMQDAKAYHNSPVVYNLTMFDSQSTLIGGSPRFDVYGCDFGFGKPAAVRSGKGGKFDGMAAAFPGREGGASVDLEVCLRTDCMMALLRDPEFLDALSSTNQ